SANELAMLAYASSSGSNRSGWLNRAHARAKQQSDAATLGFIDRRIVAERVASGLFDWAATSLRDAGLDRREDAEAVLLSALVDARLGTESLR
ncbi:hypothetical protein ABTB75_19075, partial [Acinetobacter baumannii]